MKLRIGSRKSDLARVQAFAVAEQVQKVNPHIQIEFEFKSSLGDKNQSDPLWKMPEKGVFTEDLSEDLRTGRVDIVVHSWKDLPTQRASDTLICATLPRADTRDILLFKKTSFKKLENGEAVKVMTSSPRRTHNLGPVFRWALPYGRSEVRFQDIRGNILTRFRKLMEATDVDGLILAKAGIDRLLTAVQPEFKDIQVILRQFLDELLVMVLPLKENPPAAAQGALAIECLRDRADLMELFRDINCQSTFNHVHYEREFLSRHGGGCHQKIGIVRFSHPYGVIESSRGLTDQGQTLRSWRFLDADPVQGDLIDFFPKTMSDGRMFLASEVPNAAQRVQDHKDLWITRVSAWPKDLSKDINRTLWAAGQDTWRKLASQGHWINGCSEGLGDALGPKLDTICGRSMDWIHLTHTDAVRHRSAKSLATYSLVPNEELDLDFDQISHFFWTSFSNFEQAVRLHPQMRDKYHACGPGLTAGLLKMALGDTGHLQVFVSYEEWRDRLPRKK